MAVGSKIVSAYAGPADPTSFDQITHVPTEKSHERIITPELERLHVLYQKVRDMRNSKEVNEDRLKEIWSTVQSDFDLEWLLPLEIYEISKDESLKDELKSYLLGLENKIEVFHLVSEGLQMIDEQEGMKLQNV